MRPTHASNRSTPTLVRNGRGTHSEDPGLNTLLVAAPTAGAQATDLGLASTGGGGIGYIISPDGTLIASKLWTENETWVVTEVVSSTSSNAGFTTYESAGWQRRAP